MTKSKYLEFRDRLQRIINSMSQPDGWANVALAKIQKEFES